MNDNENDSDSLESEVEYAEVAECNMKELFVMCF